MWVFPLSEEGYVASSHCTSEAFQSVKLGKGGNEIESPPWKNPHSFPKLLPDLASSSPVPDEAEL